MKNEANISNKLNHEYFWLFWSSPYIASDSTSGNDLFFFDTGRGSGESSSTGSERKSSTTSYYDSLFKRYGKFCDNSKRQKKKYGWLFECLMKVIL